MPRKPKSIYEKISDKKLELDLLNQKISQINQELEQLNKEKDLIESQQLLAQMKESGLDICAALKKLKKGE